MSSYPLKEGITAPGFQFSGGQTTARQKDEQASKYEDSAASRQPSNAESIQDGNGTCRPGAFADRRVLNTVLVLVVVTSLLGRILTEYFGRQRLAEQEACCTSCVNSHTAALRNLGMIRAKKKGLGDFALIAIGSALVGLTAQQLYDNYGLAMNGNLAPTGTGALGIEQELVSPESLHTSV
jgi:hypothetical protein